MISSLFTLLLVVLLSPSVGAQNQAKDRAKLIDDAKKEGKVVVYVSSNASDARALKSAFEKKYPFINMEFYSSGKDALLTRDRKSTRLNSSHIQKSRMPSSA